MGFFRCTAVFLRIVGFGLAPFALVAAPLSGQEPGPNRSVLTGFVDPLDPDAEIKTDMFLQRQNEPAIAPSSVNPDHLIAAANDYRTIDVGEDFGLGESNESFLAIVVRTLRAGLTRLVGWPGVVPSKPAATPEAWMGVYRSCNRAQSWVGGLVPGSPRDLSPASLASPLRGLTAASDPVLHSAPNGYAYLGGLAFIRDGISRIFVARYRDRVDREGGLCFAYELTRVVESGAANPDTKFLDKPAIAATVPEPGREFGNVYLAYTSFTNAQSKSEVHFARSLDGGDTWSQPITISSTNGLNQGTALAVDPRNGTVYAVWRDFRTTRMLMAVSTNSGQSFTAARSLHRGFLESFDQPTGPDRFRTNGFPTLAVDGNGKLFAAWQERVNATGAPDAFGTPRIVLTMSTDGGRTWSPRRAVDIAPRVEEEIQRGLGDIVTRPSGPQVMPALSASASQLMLAFYEAKEDLSADGFISGVERQMDARVAILDPANGSVIGSSVQVSEYSVAATDPPQLVETAPGYAAVSRPGLPMFQFSGAAFFGDYVHLTPAVPFVKNERGWRWATAPEDVPGPSFHQAFTDNRNARFPGGDIFGDWGPYAAPGSGLVSCINPGSRNQDVYVAEISSGIVAGSPSAFKPLLRENGEEIQRAFVVYVENRTNQPRRIDLEVFPTDPATTSGSFDQFDPIELLQDFEIFPYSTITREVYVSSPVEDASARVEVRDALTGAVLSRVPLNAFPPDPLFPLTNTAIGDSEVHTPRISNPRISNPRISNPRISNASPSNPRISNPRISNGALSDSAEETTDVTFEVTNDGNTTTAFDLLANVPNAEDLLASGKYEFQLLVYRSAVGPSVGTQDPTCSPIPYTQDEVISNVASPRISNAGDPNPRISNPRISNVAFYAEPAEGPSGSSSLRAPAAFAAAPEDLHSPVQVSRVFVTLRTFRTGPLAPGDPIFDPRMVSATVVSQSNNVVNGVIDDDPPFASVGPNPPVPLKEIDGDLVPFDVPPLPAVGLAFSAQPSDSPAGDTIAPSVQVRIVDASSGTVPTTGVPITIALGANPGGGVLAGTATGSTENGVAVFDDLAIDASGTGYTLVSSASGLVSAESTSFDIAALPIVVADNPADSGPGSLREAIVNANSNPGRDVIAFDFPGPGPHVIQLDEELPAFTEPVTIDGTTEPDFAPGAPSVVIDGSGMDLASGLVIAGGDSIVRGIQIVGFDGNGIELLSDGNVVENCVIGTDGAGTLDLGNAEAGILVAGSNNRIGTLAPKPGSLVDTLGSSGMGNGQFAVFGPRDIEIDSASGDLFASDMLNHRVQQFGADGSFQRKWGRNGGDGTPGSADGEFNRPWGLAVDAAGSVYVADSLNHRVQKFLPDGTFLLRWGANGGDGSSGIAPGEFNDPRGIARGFAGASETLYVVDSMNHRVQQFTTLGGYLRSWGGRGNGPGEFDVPRGIAVGEDGSIYVADGFNRRIQKFVPGSPCPPSTIQVTPGMCFVTEWGSLGVDSGEFELPHDIGVDSQGRVYVSDLLNNRYQVFDSDGGLIAVRGVAGDGDGEFFQPTGIALDSGDNLYVAQQLLPDIQKFETLFGSFPGPNVIAFNRGFGVNVVSGVGNQVLASSIYASPQSIATLPAGANPAGPGVPVLTESASVVDYGVTKVNGTLNSTPETRFRLDFFFSFTCGGGGGDGRSYMGSAEVTTDFEGAATFAAVLPFESADNGFASANATGPSGGTTELSGCISHGIAPRLLVTDFVITGLPKGIAGEPYDASLGAAGGTPEVGFSPWTDDDAASLASLGLSLDGDGNLEGTPTASFSSFFVVAEDSGSPAQVDLQELVVDIVDPIAVVTSSLPSAVVGSPYSQFLAATGGSGTYSWGVVSETSLPAGLTLDPATGEIRGVPTAVGTRAVVFGAFEADGDFPDQVGRRGMPFSVDLRGAPARLAFASQPASVGVGQAFTVSVAIQDAFGNHIDNADGVISLSIASGPGSLAGIASRAAVEGLAVFTGLSIDTAGSDYVLRATGGETLSAFSAPFDVNASAPFLLTFLGQPSNNGVGDRFSPSVRVAIQNGAGETIATATNAVQMTIFDNPGGGSLAGATTVEAVGGIATFPDLRLNQLTGAGSGYRLRAAVGALGLSSLSAPFNVDASLRIKHLFLSPLGTENLEGTFESVLDPATNRLYLQSGQSDRIGVFDTLDNEIVAAVPMDGEVRGIALDTANDRLWVAIQFGRAVRALDTENLTIDAAREIALSVRPIHVAVDDDGSDRLFIAGPGFAAVFDLATVPPTQVGADIALPGPVSGAFDAMALDKTDDTFYVGHAQGVTIVRSDASFEEVNLDRPGLQMALNSTTRKLYVSTDRDVAVIDDSGPTPTVTTLADANIIEPFGVDVNTVTNTAYIALGGTNAILVIDGEDQSFSFVTGSSLQLPTRVAVDESRNLVWVTNAETSFFPAIITRIDAGNGNAVSGFTIPVSNNDIVVDESRNLLYMTKGNLAYLSVASGDDPSMPIAERYVGASLRGFDLTDDGRLFLANVGLREIRAVEKDSLAPLDVISRFSRMIGVNDATGKLYASHIPPGKGADDPAELLEFDLATLAPTRVLPTPGFDANLIVDEVNDRVYSLGGRFVPGPDFNDLLVIDTSSGRATEIDPGLFPQRGVVHGQRGNFYTPMVDGSGNRTLGVVKGTPPALVPIDLSGSFSIADLDIEEENERVYAGSGSRIFVIDTTDDSLRDTITLTIAAPVEALGVNPTTNHLFVATSLGIEVYDIDDDVNEIITTIPMGVTASYNDVAVDPQNNLVAFSNSGDRSIVVVSDDIDVSVRTFSGIKRARSAPRGGLRFDPDTARLYVLDSLTGSVVSIGPLR